MGEQKREGIRREIIADLHIHSKYSRATSKDLDIPNLVKWARVKGIDLLGTGDFTHPKWLEELKQLLVEREGALWYKDSIGEFPFILSSELSFVYTKNEKGRRVHLIVLAPSFEVVDKINNYIDEKGFRRDYDGRPIFGIDIKDFVKDLVAIDSNIEIIPAHCLLPEEYIHVTDGIKKIKDIQKGDFVYTHNNRLKRVNEVLVRDYTGEKYGVVPWYFMEGTMVTPEHPFYAIKSYKDCRSTKGLCKPLCSQIKKGCARRYFEKYVPSWVMAKDLQIGDFLVYPRFNIEKDLDSVDLRDYIEEFRELGEDFILSKNSRNHRGKIKKILKVNKEFCKLIGYFLSEGYLIRDSAIGFSFHIKEKQYIEEVILAIKNCFGFKITSIDSRRDNQADLIFSSKLLNGFFRNFYSEDGERAKDKILPKTFLFLKKDKAAEILRGWWRGDTGYTISRQLANQMKLICLKLGIIPSIFIDTAEKHKKRGNHFFNGREICAKSDLIVFSNLSFFEKDYGMFKENCFKKSINKINRKHGWIDKDYIYLPIRKIEISQYKGEVYNLEVDEDNSYVTEFSCVHNCWTPYFGVFGSKGGFDSLDEAFGEQADNIHAIETGISSDPLMNVQIKELVDRNISIVSFSDLHSFWPWRIGREATVFRGDIKEVNYKEIIRQIRENDFISTIETDPAYGKYHWDGHAKCEFSCGPSQTKELDGKCPKCGKALTIGVEYRVEELSKIGKEGEKKNTSIFAVSIPPQTKKFFRLLPLHELIAFSLGVRSPNSKKVWEIYNKLIEKFGNEYEILLRVDKNILANELEGNEELFNLIIDNRISNIKIQPGYDGEYGKIVLKDKQEQKKLF